MISIVYPAGVNWFYEDIAKRTAQDLKRVFPVSIYSAHEFASLPFSQAQIDHVIIVNMYECAYSLESSEAAKIFAKNINRAGRRTLILSEQFSTKWFKEQFSYGVEWSEIVEYGFVKQTEDAKVFGFPYLLCPDVPTQDELKLMQHRLGARPISWSYIGARTDSRVALCADLVKHFGTNCFLFLPEIRPCNPKNGRLGKEQLYSIQKKTHLYFWESHHNWPYVESLRYLTALLNGSIPIKIDPKHHKKFRGIPNIYPNVETCAATLREKSSEDIYRSVAQWLNHYGPLAENFRSVLRI